MYPAMEEKVVEVREHTRVIMNGEGLLAEVPLKGGGSSIPHFLKSSIETPEDWKRIKEEHFNISHPGRLIDIAALKKNFPSDEERDFPLGVDCGSMIGKIRDMLTFEGLAYAVYDYPEMVEDMVETSCALVEHSLDQLLPNFKFDYASGWEDICFNYGPIVSIDFFRNVVMPRYKRISKKLSANGIDIWYTDCDGDVRPILPYLLEGGINCLFPYEVNSCAHPGVLLDQYQGQLRIMGGVDKMALGKGKEAIKSYLESLEKYVARGGYIPFCDHRCPPNVKPEDYLYYLDLKEKMFGFSLHS
jgi:uroporphyrinogen decarboxylase